MLIRCSNLPLPNNSTPSINGFYNPPACIKPEHGKDSNKRYSQERGLPQQGIHRGIGFVRVLSDKDMPFFPAKIILPYLKGGGNRRKTYNRVFAAMRIISSNS